MKKTLIFMMTVLLVLTMAASVVAAGELGMSLSADQTTLKRGDSVTVTVSVSEFADCKSGALTLSYNSAQYTVSGQTWLVSNTTMNEPTGDAVFAFSEAKSVSGAVYKFTLTAKEDASFEASDVTVKLQLKNSGGTTTAETKTLSITVACSHSYGDWSEDGDNHSRTCSACGNEETKSHTWNDGEETKAATCKEEGTKTFTCTACGATKTETIPTGSHNWGSGEVTKAATCKEEGVKTFTCGTCGETKTEKIPVSSDHSYGAWEQEDVSTHSRKCSVCGKEQTKNHDWSDKEVIQAVTCTEDGEERYECACGAVKTEVLEATGHNYGENWTSDATDHWHACTACGEELERVPHNPGPEATEETDQVCLDCGYVIVAAENHEHAHFGDIHCDETAHWYLCACGEEMDRGDHEWNEGLEQEGKLVYTCTVCGTTYSEDLPDEPDATDPAVPDEPDATDPAVPDDEKPEQPGGNDQDTPPEPVEPASGFAWWWYVLIGVGVLLLGAVIFVIIGVVVSNKQLGKFSGE